MKNYKELSRITFDKQAKIYDDTPSAKVSKYPKMCYPFVQEKLGESDFQRLLDVGAGTGELIRLLQADHPEANYFGLDISEFMIEVAKGKHIPNSTFAVGDAEDLPYNDNWFDVVTCVQSIHHYPKVETAMHEVWRVLKPGGFYIICDMTFRNPLMRWFANHVYMPFNRMGDVKIYGKKDMEVLFKKTGFQRFRYYQIHPNMYMITGKK